MDRAQSGKNANRQRCDGRGGALDFIAGALGAGAGFVAESRFEWPGVFFMSHNDGGAYGMLSLCFRLPFCLRAEATELDTACRASHPPLWLQSIFHWWTGAAAPLYPSFVSMKWRIRLPEARPGACARRIPGKDSVARPR